MKPFELLIFEFLLGYGLQAFAIVLGIFAFNHKKIVLRKYIQASILVNIISYLVRLLPISFGVHTILNILFMFLIGIIILKMPSFNTMRSALLVTILLLVCEMIDVAVMITIFGKDKFDTMMLDPLQKAIIGLPGTVFFAVLVLFAYYLLTYKVKRKGEINGDPST